jgi:membrane-associated phospholipid phosphatase
MAAQPTAERMSRLPRPAPPSSGHASAPPSSGHASAQPYRVKDLGQVALCVAATTGYFGIRSLTEGKPETAFLNADRVLQVERALGLDHEQVLQQAVIGSRALTVLFDRIYIYGHWPVIAVVLIWLLARHRETFRRLRDAMLVSGLAGMVVFATFPVAPPRLAMAGLVDTIVANSPAYRVLQPPAFTNQYAAMPSLHVGWDLLVGLAVWVASGRLWLRLLGLAMPVAMTLAVLLTANHYVLDVVAGAALAGTAWLVCCRRHRLQGTRTAAPAAAARRPRPPGPARDVRPYDAPDRAPR